MMPCLIHSGQGLEYSVVASERITLLSAGRMRGSLRLGGNSDKDPLLALLLFYEIPA